MANDRWCITIKCFLLYGTKIHLDIPFNSKDIVALVNIFFVWCTRNMYTYPASKHTPHVPTQRPNVCGTWQHKKCKWKLQQLLRRRLMHKICPVPWQVVGVCICSPFLVQVIRAEENNCCDESKTTNCHHDATQCIVVSSNPRVGTQHNRLQKRQK